MYRIIGTDDIIKEGDPHLKVNTRCLYVAENIRVKWIDWREGSAFRERDEVTIAVEGTIEDYEIEENLPKGNTFLQLKTKEE